MAATPWQGGGSETGTSGSQIQRPTLRVFEKEKRNFYRNSPWAVSDVHLICTVRWHLCVIISIKIRATNSEKPCTEESTHFLQFPCSYVITLSTTTKNTVIFDCTAKTRISSRTFKTIPQHNAFMANANGQFLPELETGHFGYASSLFIKTGLRKNHPSENVFHLYVIFMHIKFIFTWRLKVQLETTCCLWT